MEATVRPTLTAVGMVEAILMNKVKGELIPFSKTWHRSARGRLGMVGRAAAFQMRSRTSSAFNEAHLVANSIAAGSTEPSTT